MHIPFLVVVQSYFILRIVSATSNNKARQLDLYEVVDSRNIHALRQTTDFRDKFPTTCQVQCGALINALECGGTTQCSCTTTLANDLPFCQACLQEVVRHEEAEQAINATGDLPTQTDDSDLTKAQNILAGSNFGGLQQLCASAGSPIGGTASTGASSPAVPPINQSMKGSSSSTKGSSSDTPSTTSDKSVTSKSNGARDIRMKGNGQMWALVYALIASMCLFSV